MRAKPRKEKAPPCPRCKSTETTQLTNFGKPMRGRYRCWACRRTWDTVHTNAPDFVSSGGESDGVEKSVFSLPGGEEWRSHPLTLELVRRLKVTVDEYQDRIIINGDVSQVMFRRGVRACARGVLVELGEEERA